MKGLKICLLGTVSSLALVGSAMAADLRVKAAPAPIIPYAIWTGPYIGGHVGGLVLTGDITNDNSGGRCEIFGDNQCVGTTLGWVGGVQIGYNWQTRYWVWGVEAD